MIGDLLAVVSGDSMSPAAVGTIIGTLIASLIAGGFLGKKVSDSNKTHILNSPLDVRLKEEFVTRREFEKLELTMNTHISDIKGTVTTATAEMKGLFNLTMAEMKAQTTSMASKVERQSRDLREEISRLAENDFDGRTKIWEQVNVQREGLAAIRATSDVASQIGKLADAITPSSPKIQPTTSHG